MKRILRAAISFVLLVCVAVSIFGCSAVGAEDLMDGVTARSVEPPLSLDGGNAAYVDFALRLFLASEGAGEGNVIISPLSVMCALAMTANGAKGDTLVEMEAALGMSIAELNPYLHGYLASLPSGEKYEVSLANSIWFNSDERLTVNGDFLQINADYYGADVYREPFDRGTKRDINNWVKNETDGMIPKIIDRIPSDAVMYLVNALAFEAEWASIYEKNEVGDGYFTTADGERQRAEFMYAKEHSYLRDELAEGFMKYYSGGKYAFAALLPNAGVTLAEYLRELDGEGLYSILSSAESRAVRTSLPKFEVEYGCDMVDALMSMGIEEAFIPYVADFSALGESAEGGIHISRALHKAKIEVGERGTRAGAVTSVEMGDGSAGGPGSEIKTVYLDRPFLYMIIDCENNAPLFVGVLNKI